MSAVEWKLLIPDHLGLDSVSAVVVAAKGSLQFRVIRADVSFVEARVHRQLAAGITCFTAHALEDLKVALQGFALTHNARGSYTAPMQSSVISLGILFHFYYNIAIRNHKK